ncbi:hypothetical protein Psal071_01028 [Piscirickettsia salmonis]|uniref:Uncharacterized protein n=1 Tax=Piscirickettsia salmonis TaxID=1238 RepID=A0A9Q6LRQ8_PISSA|nr:hypothetical protein [Piscirickettsia salmonis]ALA24439.1 membrane protein [Piscirickettsia salmonis]APS44803.1 hypothetical protein AVI48_10795 [Piscirickettsia salmonis]APS48162.1 hypothetical protein AVI49_11400 [Piscirickettsia salmonis]APS49432.1 hypothetical protein AVI50_00085 [Piscirickettsia salmonis]QGN95651.1 hypothetical protein Psal006a_02271 [Piscirickettsia salmonis]
MSTTVEDIGQRLTAASRTSPLLPQHSSQLNQDIQFPHYRRNYLFCVVKGVMFFFAMSSGLSGFSSGKSLEDLIDNKEFINAVGIIASLTYSFFNTNATKDLINRIAQGSDSLTKKISCLILAAIAATPGVFLTYNGLQQQDNIMSNNLMSAALSSANFFGSLFATMNAMLLAPTDSEKFKKQIFIYICAFIAAAALLVAPTLSATQGLERAFPHLSSAANWCILSICNILSASIFTQGLVDFQKQLTCKISYDIQEKRKSNRIITVLAYMMASFTALSFAALNLPISDNEVFQITSMSFAGIATAVIWGSGLNQLFQSAFDYISDEIKRLCCTDSQLNLGPDTPMLFQGIAEAQENASDISGYGSGRIQVVRESTYGA